MKTFEMDKDDRDKTIQRLIDHFGPQHFEMDSHGNIRPVIPAVLTPEQQEKDREERETIDDKMKAELEKQQRELLENLPPAVRARMEEILIEQEAREAIKRYEKISVDASDIGIHDYYATPYVSDKLTYSKMRDLQADKAVEEILVNDKEKDDGTKD